MRVKETNWSQELMFSFIGVNFIVDRLQTRESGMILNQERSDFMSLQTRFGSGLSVVALLAATVFSLFVTSAALADSPALLVGYDFENVTANQGVDVPAPPSFEAEDLAASDLSIVQGSGVDLLDTAERDGVVVGNSNQMSFEQGIEASTLVDPWKYNSFQFDISAVVPYQITSIAFSTGHNDADNDTPHDGIIEYWRDGSFLGSDTFNVANVLGGRPVDVAPANLILRGQPTTFKIRFNQIVFGDNSPTTQLRIDDVEVYGVPVTTPQIYSPNGGEIVRSGSTYAIKWGAPAEATLFDLKYSCDNGSTWTTIATGQNPQAYSWSVPTLKENKTKCLVKVIGKNESGSIGSDTSDGPFTIEVIKLDSPNGGGAAFTSGEVRSIVWTTNAIKGELDKVILSYTLNDGAKWVKIVEIADGSNPGAYDEWLVPDVTESKTKCKVKVQLKAKNGDAIGSDVSNGYFTINPIPPGR
jgi:hypothetical protein